MKRFDRLIVCALCFCVLVAATVGAVLYRMDDENRGGTQKKYRVEINRVLGQLSQGVPLEEIVLSNGVETAEFLDARTTDADVVDEFYREENDVGVVIHPWVQNGTVKGYLRFTYRMESLHLQTVFLLAEGGILLLSVLLLGILLFLRKRIIRPFHQLSTLPEKLAQGHYRGDVTVEKSRYFQDFLWGMSQLNDTLEVSRRRQYELLRDKKQLLLSLSHDIKTPLNLIKLYGKALEDGLCPDEESRRDAVRQIGQKSREIEQYVNQIIVSSKEDLLDFRVEQGEFYLNELMDSVLGIYRGQCQRRNVTLRVEDYENRLLKGDLHRAQEVFENLFENAFKYGDGREIWLSFYEEEYCQLIRLHSTGSPVSEQEFPHLFDSFFRGANSSGQQGSGLGLYICRELMRKMEGDIFAQTDADGMAFVVVFR